MHRALLKGAEGEGRIYHINLILKVVFSCEDAAQQVLMSVCVSVCLCVCVSVRVPITNSKECTQTESIQDSTRQEINVMQMNT